jgi:hypothetical protein
MRSLAFQVSLTPALKSNLASCLDRSRRSLILTTPLPRSLASASGTLSFVLRLQAPLVVDFYFLACWESASSPSDSLVLGSSPLPGPRTVCWTAPSY